MIARALAPLRGDSLAARARRGSILSVITFGSQNVFRLVSNLVLTRILFPEAFGLMALVQVVTTGLLMFSDVGIRASLIRHERGDDPSFVNTAWTLQVIRGVCLSLATALAAPFAAEFYDEPMLLQLLPVAGLAALIAGFTPTRIVTADRHVRLGRQTALGIVNQILVLSVTALLAWLMQSVWALVIGNLVGGLLRNASIRMFLPGLPNRFAWDRSAVRDLVGFGKYVFIGTLAGFVIAQGDRIVLGRFIELDALGIYTIAFTLASMPVTMMRNLSWKLVFSLYSRRPPQASAANRRRLSQARFGLTGAAFAGSVALVLLGEPLVQFLYDPRYHAAGSIAVLIALGLLPPIIVASYDSILLSSNRSGLHAFATVVHATLRLSVLVVAIAEYGIVGAALAPVVSTLIYYPLMIGLVWKYRVWDPLHDIVFALLSLGLAALAWWLEGPALLDLSLS